MDAFLSNLKDLSEYFNYLPDPWDSRGLRKRSRIVVSRVCISYLELLDLLLERCHVATGVFVHDSLWAKESISAETSSEILRVILSHLRGDIGAKKRDPRLQHNAS
jgi:hypothetical protein